MTSITTRCVLYLKIFHMLVLILVLRVYVFIARAPFSAPTPVSKSERSLLIRRIHGLVPFQQTASATAFWRKYLHLVSPLPEVFADIPTLLRRKELGNDEDLNDSLLVRYQHCPDYYLKNYHHQTDGYLSEASARRYDFQYEVVFLGLGETVRKVAGSQLLRFLSDDKPYMMLELGTGTGNFGAIMQDYYSASDILLSDPSVDYLKHAQKKFSHLKFRQQSTFAEDLSFADDHTYDVVFSSFVFHEIPQRYIVEAFSEIRRCLKPGGYVLMLDSSQDHDGEENVFAINQFAENFHEPYFEAYRNTPLEKHFSSHQFEVVYTQMVLFSKLIIARA